MDKRIIPGVSNVCAAEKHDACRMERCKCHCHGLPGRVTDRAAALDYCREELGWEQPRFVSSFRKGLASYFLIDPDVKYEAPFMLECVGGEVMGEDTDTKFYQILKGEV